MNKKLQDYVWSILPKEFREEVKETYEACIKMMDIRPSHFMNIPSLPDTNTEKK